MGPPRKGRTFNCMYCGEDFYRRPSHVRRGITKTCGKRACISESVRGDKNPFWGASHTADTRDTLKIIRGLDVHNQNRAKRVLPPPTPETRAKLSAKLKERWLTNRDKMIACLPRGPIKTREQLRYRRNFSRHQRRDWAEGSCRWCGSKEDLVLDHIIPVMCGGENERSNAQSLCRPCNLWKMVYVDRPLYLAGLRPPAGLSQTKCR